MDLARREIYICRERYKQLEREKRDRSKSNDRDPNLIAVHAKNKDL